MEMTQPSSDPILDSINEGVFTVDHEWRITSFNRAAERITGVRKQDALGRICSDVFRASICEGACALRRTFASGEPIVSATANIIKASGKRIPIRISTALLRRQDGTAIGGVETFQDLSRVEQLRKELEARYTFEDIVGRSPAMRTLFDVVPQIAASHSTVLIEGDSGTGKELFARAIHNLSSRSKKRFVAVNCAALPDTLLESELFGYKAGAFTDARHDKPGRFVLAHGGTIFLDEIGDVSPAMQARLLRVLQERCVEPLGATEPVKVDVRVLAATNKIPEEAVAKGQLRNDLYYRLNVFSINMPPLREHKEDIPSLVEVLIKEMNRKHSRSIRAIDEEVMSKFQSHSWPGNVRELRNTLERAVIVCDSTLVEARHLPPGFGAITAHSALNDANAIRLGVGTTVEDAERQLILKTLESTHNNKTRAAEILGISLKTLHNKLKEYGTQGVAAAAEVQGH